MRTIASASPTPMAPDPRRATALTAATEMRNSEKRESVTRMTSWLPASRRMTARRLPSPASRSRSRVRRAARARVRVVRPWIASRYSALRRARLRRDPEEDDLSALWKPMTSAGTPTTATARTAEGTGSTAIARSTSTSAGASAAAIVGARKVCRYRATRSAPSDSTETVEPVRCRAARAGPRSMRWARTRRRSAASSRAALPSDTACAPAAARAETAPEMSAEAMSAPSAWPSIRAPSARPAEMSDQPCAREARTVRQKETRLARLDDGVARGIRVGEGPEWEEGAVGVGIQAIVLRVIGRVPESHPHRPAPMGAGARRLLP